jgi:phosphomannomutase
MADRRDAMPEVFNTPEVRFDCPEERKFEVIQQVKAQLATGNAEVNTTDGVRVRTPEGWWLLRASNTQPVLVARVEASSPAALERLKGEVRGTLAAVGIAAPAGF